MSEIKNLKEFELRVRCCVELKIPKPGDVYTHHVFVGKKDETGCDLYHYTSVSSFLKVCGQIIHERFDYKEYKKGTSSVRKIFDFGNGDTIYIVERRDYPKDKKAEDECIKRAEQRLNEQNYSARFNNCESYVNWIFSGNNTSQQVENDKTRTVLGNIVDGASSRGAQRQFSQVPDPAAKVSKKVGGKLEEKCLEKMESMLDKLSMSDLIRTQTISISRLKSMIKSPNDIKTLLNGDISKLNLNPKMREELGKMILPSNILNFMKDGPAQNIMFEQFQSGAQKHYLRTVAKQAKTGSIKQASNQSVLGALGFPVVVEVASLLIKMHNIENATYMSEEAKSQQRKQEVCSSAFGLTGMIIGQMCFPVPVVGGFVGGLIGNIVGGAISEI